ncbi:hypothetical protein E6W39_19065 [Kitasatospora acidiphila]|uniref:Uncharacterized protein n=1 Tax=Kitasatospora acidiphila TaxID=2567942 RepID=A0A540W4Q2_9ACTN|nr:hypothetical protein [Kitasatospora acidiphila]TQF03953.1 hypothetical protein E6W39_19065 [Kitasatospora acidiphila]
MKPDDTRLIDSLEEDMYNDKFFLQANNTRTRVRYASEMAAGIEVDAIEAGLSKDAARMLSIRALEYMTGLVLVAE